LPKTNFGAGIPDLDTFRIVSYLLLTACGLHWSIKKDIKLFNRWIIMLVVFYLYVFASVSWSQNFYRIDIIRDLIDKTFIPFFMALVAYNLFQKEENAKIYVKHLTIAALISSLISVFQMSQAMLQGYTEFRTSGTFTNPNELAIILVLTLPCILYAVEKKVFPKVFVWIVLVSLVAGIICTVSRKGIITMMLCFCLYNLFKTRFRNLFYAVFALALVTVLIYSVPIVAQRFESKRFSLAFEEKWSYTSVGLKMFKQNPVIGLGYEGYRDHFNEYFPLHKRKRFDAHNIFITALSNYGLLGFILFLFLFFYPLTISYKTWKQKQRRRRDSNSHSYDMAIICILSIIPFMVIGWFAGGLFYKPIVVSLLYSNIALSLAVNE
jgi:O-antigen ligase